MGRQAGLGRAAQSCRWEVAEWEFNPSQWSTFCVGEEMASGGSSSSLRRRHRVGVLRHCRHWRPDSWGQTERLPEPHRNGCFKEAGGTSRPPSSAGQKSLGVRSLPGVRLH